MMVPVRGWHFAASPEAGRRTVCAPFLAGLRLLGRLSDGQDINLINEKVLLGDDGQGLTV